MSSNFGVLIDRIRRYKWLVAIVTLIGAIGGISSAMTAKTEYIGQAVLTAATESRPAEEDTGLSQGYVFFFNEPSYQVGLAERAGVEGDVLAYSARTAALSPVFYITATSNSADEAQKAATTMALQFAKEVNDEFQQTRDATIAAMTKELQDIWGARLALNEPQALSAQAQLQQRINDLLANRVNDVTVLQPEGGVVALGPAKAQDAALGLLGGLLLGCIAAVLFGAISKRIVTDYDVAGKAGLEVLEVLPPTGDPRYSGARAVRLGHLANIVTRPQPGHSTTIAVAASAGGPTADEIGTAIATHRAAQGIRTVLIHADLHEGTGDRRGLADLLSPTDPIGLADALTEVSANFHTIGPGVARANPVALFEPTRWSDLLATLKSRADLVVVCAPALARNAEAQVIADAVDKTLLVVEQGTRVDDVREAVRVLEQVGAELAGVVLAETGATAPVGKDVPAQARPETVGATAAGSE
ncbi:hypothetical protein [Antrihabitans sp. YC2-6]|uniref:hypothetical protein n=1 Tax=Antrihabitans sp. YC2-6 TaxID=2799498 RepID=UPI0018F2CAAA|nr:hypothetical protein [Antrihabitans sp. YC2-6]MBJ8343998.1 hypothetical protein [Antrihabitans sp. YC2-6]